MDIVVSQDFFPKIGGAHLWLYETYRRWPTSVHLLTRISDTLGDGGSAEAQFDDLDHGALQIHRRDIGIDRIDLLAAGCWVRFWGVTREIGRLRDEAAATIHCLRAFPEGFAGLLARLRHPHSTRLVTYAHGEEVLIAKSSRQLKLLAGLVYRHSDLVIANSRSTESLVRELAPDARIVRVHPGVDAQAYVCDPARVAEVRRGWNWPEGTVVVGTVARMESRKNQAMVIRAVARLRQQGLPVAYVCGGDGEEKAKLVETARALGISDWVHFVGILSEEEKSLTCAAMDIYAMPSIQTGQLLEGFGIVFLEAAAAGIPSVAGNVGGQPEAVIDGKTGLVVDGTDLSQVEAAIRRLATDGPLRARMALDAISWARKNDWRVVAEQVGAAVGALARPAQPREQTQASLAGPLK